MTRCTVAPSQHTAAVRQPDDGCRKAGGIFSLNTFMAPPLFSRFIQDANSASHAGHSPPPTVQPILHPVAGSLRPGLFQIPKSAQQRVIAPAYGPTILHCMASLRPGPL